MNKYTKPIIAFFSMFLIQTVASFFVLIPILLFQFINMAQTETNPDLATALGHVTEGTTVISYALILSSIITVIFMQYPLKMLKLKDSFNKPNLSLCKAAYLILAAFVGIYATDIIGEVMDLPNIIETELGDMSKSVVGILAISVFGPIAEEVCFRGSIQHYFHSNGVTPLRAIFITSVLFGLMHINPAQIPFAFVVGFIIGVVYWKTGSLVLPCIIHILNNGISCLLANVCGEDFSLVNLFGGTAIALCIAAIGLALCVWVLYRYAQETAA